jgi:hypothetical protein
VFNYAVSTTVVGCCVSKFLLNLFRIGGGEEYKKRKKRGETLMGLGIMC